MVCIFCGEITKCRINLKTKKTHIFNCPICGEYQFPISAADPQADSLRIHLELKKKNIVNAIEKNISHKKLGSSIYWEMNKEDSIPSLQDDVESFFIEDYLNRPIIHSKKPVTVPMQKIFEDQFS